MQTVALSMIAIGEILAQSSTVYTVNANPVKISSDNKEKVATALSTIFELDYAETLKKLNQNVAVVNIIKKVEKEKTDELRSWMDENNITVGINIDQDTKRYYPFGDLASHVIGFCGNDNQGLDGLEAKYDDVLSGTNGSIEQALDAKGSEIGNDGESYNSPISRR